MQKKIAVINDLSGYGRCSLTVAIPVLSAMGHQCCPIPTAILSNHTEFPVYFFDDYTEKMTTYTDKWKELGLSFDAIATGFLGSEAQIGIVMEIVQKLKAEKTFVVVDPVMGDQMKELVCMADVVLPNVTECCILTDTPYREENWARKELLNMAMMLRLMGAKSVVITGVREGSCYTNVVLEQGQYDAKFIRTRSSGGERPGTGDVFSSVVAGALLNGKSLPEAVSQAAGFVKECIKVSDEEQIPHANGVCFEKILGKLIKK